MVIGMLFSVALLGSSYSFIAIKYQAIGPGVNLPPQYENIGARYKESDDRIFCNPQYRPCIIAD
jgi:hypothetical protein